MKKTILTPTDFSEVANVAIDHAAQFLKASKGELILLHVVKDSAELFKAKRKMNNFLPAVREKYPFISIRSLLRIGDIYEDIGHAALENDAELIVMGTHGLQGLQIITGSRALKVISSSEVPILVVQKETTLRNNYHSILLPMTLEKDSKQKLSYVKHLALYFGSKVYLLAKEEKDEFLNNKIRRDMNFSEAYFSEANVPHQSDYLNQSDNVESYMDYAEQNEIDMLVFMNNPESVYTLFDAKLQRLITNKSKLPVLLINPRSTSFVTVFGNYSGQG